MKRKPKPSTGAYVNAPHGWEPAAPVESAEGCLYPTWRRVKPKKKPKKKK